MPKMYFICGFIGSGKTTFSTALAKSEPAFRFSLDEWMIPLYGEHMERDVFDSRIDTLTGLFKQSALKMHELGVSVIFDFGFWSLKDRVDIAKWATLHCVDFEIIYLDVPFDECSRRATARNKDRGEKAYEMTPEMLDLFWSWFEVPSQDERNIRFRSF